MKEDAERRKEEYQKSIIDMVRKVNDEEYLRKIYSFIKVFYDKHN